MSLGAVVEALGPDFLECWMRLGAWTAALAVREQTCLHLRSEVEHGIGVLEDLEEVAVMLVAEERAVALDSRMRFD